MPKTYYLGKTKAGAFVGRASGRDYGYTHAAVKNPGKYVAGQVVPLFGMSFSRSAGGAIDNVARSTLTVSPEIVELKIVDRAEYKAATGKA
jgi:hypothetical protein